MDYKEQYNAALERARELSKTVTGANYEYIFPELKESEDERTRKELIEFLKLPHSRFVGNREHEKWIAWLEKQGEKEYIDPDTLIQQRVDALADIVAEQKPTNKVEPKFKVGDWITDGYLHCKITEILDDRYIIEYKFSERSAILFEDENSYYLWTIRDAKDGDVLATYDFIFIFKSIDNSNGVHYYCHYEIDKHEDDEQFGVALPQSLMGHADVSHYAPATKEQRDLLFRNMKEAGYQWDNEKNELKKIEQDNPAWSEEDEEMLTWLCRIIHSLKARKEITPIEESELGEWMDKWLNHNPQAKQGHMLDPDKVIEWLVANICDFEYYVKLFKRDFGL